MKRGARPLARSICSSRLFTCSSDVRAARKHHGDVRKAVLFEKACKLGCAIGIGQRRFDSRVPEIFES